MAQITTNYSQVESRIRQEIQDLLKENLGNVFSPDLAEISYPPETKQGDFSVPCFLLAKILKKPPTEVSQQLAGALKPSGLIVEIKSFGPYLNFFVDRAEFSKLILGEIFRRKEKYASAKIGKDKKIMIEYFSPNTNKPLTIGHVRNICLGYSIARLLKFLGYKIIESTLYNDRGIAIAKTIVGYQKWGNNRTPKIAGQKPDHFVGSFYVRFCQQAKENPELDQQAKKVLQLWEKGDQEILALWQKLMKWVLEGFDQTLNKLGVTQWEEKYYESEYYQKGKQIIEQGLKQGVFIKNADGVVLAPLEKYGLPDKILLRPDDTSLYITQDLYLAYLKDRHRLDRSIYVVGSEQDLYFQQLFEILKLLDFKNKNYFHLSYGMIRLPSGKIKSREGVIKGTGADDLIGILEDLARAEIKLRNKDIKEKEIEKRAEKIALAALKFYILNVNPSQTMVFDPKQSIAFAGKTGPYLQYVCARINSIFVKAEIKPSTRINFSVLAQPFDFELIKLLARFPAVVDKAANNYDPAGLAAYLYELAKIFSLFYENSQILTVEKEVKKARLALLNGVKTVLTTGLDLLGIEVLEKM